METEEAAMARMMRMKGPEMEEQFNHMLDKIPACIGHYDKENHNCVICYDAGHCYHQTEPRDKK